MGYDCSKIIFSESSYQSIVQETFKRPETETGGILLGHIDSEDIWYVIEVIEPGDESIFTSHYFEYDTEYVNRKANQVSQTYKVPLTVLGLWHRHPGSLDVFSSTDDSTNKAFADLNEKGAISGIVNIDPEFRLTMFHVNQSIKYLRRAYFIDDSKIPSKYFERLDKKDVQLTTDQDKVKKQSFFKKLFNSEKSKKKEDELTPVNNIIHQYSTTSQKSVFVYYPIELEKEKYMGCVYGFFNIETGIINIITKEKCDSLQKIGTILPQEGFNNYTPINGTFKGTLNDGKYEFYYQGKKVNSEAYSLINDIFSRNSGILDTDFLLTKGAIISGCGSVGSLVALELARAGVGNFLLIDNDILTHQNVCRHQCGLYDVGKNKVDAVKEKILQFNPTAKVVVHKCIIERVPKSVFDKFSKTESIIIGCADSREADLYANRIAKIYQHSFISIGFWERAFAGELFYLTDEKTPCYQCYYESIQNDGHDLVVSTNNNLYTHQENLKEVNFQPGISVDINFVTTIGIKIVLDILNKDNDTYIPTLIGDLEQLTLICNSNNPARGNENAEIFSYPLQVTTSLEVEFCGKCKEHNCCMMYK